MKQMEDWFQDVSNGKALEKIATNWDFNNWLVNLVKTWEETAGCVFMSGRYIDCVNMRSKGELEFSFSTLQKSTSECPAFGSSHLLEEFRKGVVRISDHKIKLARILPHGDNCVELHFRYQIAIEILACPHLFVTKHHKPTSDYSPRFYLGKDTFYHWCEPIIIPLPIWGCWMKGGIIDPETGIRPELQQGLAIRYDSKWYPMPICDLVQTLGPTVLEYFVSQGCLTKENAQIITYNLKQLGYSFDVPEAEKAAKDASHATAASNNTSASIAETIEAHELGAYKEKLKKAQKYEGYLLSTSVWMKILGYASRSGPTNFFKKMEEKGLLITSKGPDGQGISFKLTEKGKRIIGVF